MATTFHYTLPGGAFGTRTVDADDAPAADLPEGAELITEEQYTELLTAHQDAKAQKYAERQAADLAERQAAYDALVTVGIPGASARRIARYAPPEDGE